MTKRAFLVVVCAFVLTIIVGGYVSLRKSFVLFSEFNGRLVDASGDPVSDAEIVQSWHWDWKNRDGTKATTTDANGNFHFDQVIGRSIFASVLPHEPVVEQTITAKGEKGDVLLYKAYKHDYEADGELKQQLQHKSELKGPGINLTCRIDAEPSEDGPFYGTCKATE